MEKVKYYPRSEPICRLSDPAQPHKLCRRYDPPISVCSACKSQDMEDKRYYYYCATCDLEFHRGCHQLPPEIKHPYHSSHPLTLIFSDPDICTSQLSDRSSYDTTDSEVASISEEEDVMVSLSDRCYGISICLSICKYCRKPLQDAYYHCSICSFSLCEYCTSYPPTQTITHPKCHQHTLSLFPRQIHLPCDACGLSLDKTNDVVYTCFPCNYMVHRSCIYLPRLIKITRHPHRLSFAPCLPSGDFSCGVCREAVNINYGQYSCKAGCLYAVHSKCATRDDVWDGIDHEGVPEEPEEDIEPFVKIDDETIQHFSHEHYLRLNPYHENKLCQACILPILVNDSFYSCVECDYVLHQACASIPRKKHHPIHKHPLNLYPSISKPYEFRSDVIMEGMFKCNGCWQEVSGFVYKCGEKGCKFEVDVRCASLPDPVIHGSHPHDHPLFFNLNSGECTRCGHHCSPYYLECVLCYFFLGLKCATLPSMAHYDHDKHLMTLCYGKEEDANLQYRSSKIFWCEICESKLDAMTWYYVCEDCNVTLHVGCLLGKRRIFMKPRSTMKIRGCEVEVARNIGNSRPICVGCGCRCIDTFIFRRLDRSFCSLTCMCTSAGPEEEYSDCGNEKEVIILPHLWTC